MAKADRKILDVSLESPTDGVVELAHDWRAAFNPPVSLGAQGPAFASFTRLPEHVFARRSSYSVNRKGEILFVLYLEDHATRISGDTSVYVAGDFNGWQYAVGLPEWRLRPGSIAGRPVLLWNGQADRFLANGGQRFKFVTEAHVWLDVPGNAPNAVRDETGNVNYTTDANRTGYHLFRFTLAKPIDLSKPLSAYWGPAEACPVHPGAFFFRLKTDARLGVHVEGKETVFRLFAPRASRVELCVVEKLSEQNAAHRYLMLKRDDGAWELALSGNLDGWFYWYHVSGAPSAFTLFDPEKRLLDPYAYATVGREGPGIVVAASTLGKATRGFSTPAWQDLIIVEAHVRDLAAYAPVPMDDEERRGFTGLRKWVESPQFYLHELGVNAVELQPVQEFDNVTREEYHWGYMTNNYFAPESSYARNPEKASGIAELRGLVDAFHKRGIAVILDVVYNHVGEPAHLMFFDKLYYFETDRSGRLSNWSGCGNDLRAGAAMATRLIIDSCIHLMETYGIDGFRFDLAELLGTEVLRRIERALKRAKADVILIAEPWSFRGHIAGELRDTGWASWNDGYRNFIKDFVRGGSSREAFEYALKGSPWHFAKWPAQTVNYSESHDDRTWLDVITENGDGNGFQPTLNDRKRTHLMAAVLFSSIGIPMLAAGQDFLRSKHGVNNTYLRGDLNALDYRRIQRFPTTHDYFAGWIAFRRSDAGRLLRLFSPPADGYFQFFFAPDSTAAACIYNADLSLGTDRLLFAVNPTLQEVIIPLGEAIAACNWVQIADQERINAYGALRSPQTVAAGLILSPLSCGLWRCGS